MKYLFISDAHGDEKILTDIFKSYKNQVDQIFYNGDFELPASDLLFKDVLTVLGNMDSDLNLKKENIYQKEINIFQTHGHLYNVNYNVFELLNRAKSVNAQIVTFGHTHKLGVEVIENILFLNPGSISQPRGQFTSLGGTFAIINVDNNNYKLQYYNRSKEIIKDLYFEFELNN